MSLPFALPLLYLVIGLLWIPVSDHVIEAIAATEQQLRERGLQSRIMVDCSHANSNKDHTQQVNVLNAVKDHIKNGNRSITGVMIESNLSAGNQGMTPKPSMTHSTRVSTRARLTALICMIRFLAFQLEFHTGYCNTKTTFAASRKFAC